MVTMEAKGFAGRIRDFFGLNKHLKEDLYEDLADLLVEGDFGAAGAFKTVDKLRDRCSRMKISDGEGCRRVLAEILEEELLQARSPGQPVLEALFGSGPGGGGGAGGTLKTGESPVLLLLGVNGVGKTTTAAKLAHRFLSLNRGKPLLAAADTFRAAAIDQLKIHGERIGVRVIAHRHGGDPAAVVYDAVEAARAGAGDIIIADTAGRMHTKTALVEELKKIDRVVESKASGAPRLKLLVLDATTGRNALAQAEIFHGAVTLDGFVLTKYDSGAKGGAAYSLAGELGLPGIFLCNGESYGDISFFDPRAYTRRFIALEPSPGAGEGAD
jgi:fused signal recognition particle receptor